MATPTDLTGNTYGRLLVLKPGVGRVYTSGERSSWVCQCKCGNFIDVLALSLVTGRTKSCGCLRSELAMKAAKSHGGSKHPEYLVWQAMLNRCRNSNTTSYKYYGARGIKVCLRWHKYENFIADMGRRPTANHSIERSKVDKGYTPSNCHWSTQEAQNKKIELTHFSLSTTE